MRFIEELQQTKKWEKFEDWWRTAEFRVRHNVLIKNREVTIWPTIPLDFFTNLPFEFQKGVFEKFIISEGYHLRTAFTTSALLTKKGETIEVFDDFKDLVLAFFKHSFGP